MSIAPSYNYLEELPPQVLEPILERLSFRQIITLLQDIPHTSRLIDAITISPWGHALPIFQKHASDFRGLVSLTVLIANTRLFDLTDGLVDLNPAEFLSQFREDPRLFVEYIQDAAWAKLHRYFLDGEKGADHVTITYLVNCMPLGDISAMCPWLTIDMFDEPTIRDRFHKALTTRCKCFESYDGGFHTRHPNDRHPGFVNGKQKHPRCAARHPLDEFPEWSLKKMQVFVAAYGLLQTELNTAKADQLHKLAMLYRNHHTRLKDLLAPQTPRPNIEDLPVQLETTAHLVLRTIDLDRAEQGGIEENVAPFQYMHACLVPYDWCLRLYGRVEGINPWVRVRMQPVLWEAMQKDDMDEGRRPFRPPTPPLSDPYETEEPQPPDEIMEQMRTVRAGMWSFYTRDERWGLHTSSEQRTGGPRGCYKSDRRRDRDGFGQLTLRVPPPPQRYPSYQIRQEEALKAERRMIYNNTEMVPPVAAGEVEWLEAFVNVVKWLEEKYPEIAAQEKDAGT
ncbi:hypothetical protein QBC39DRAFT_28426 [Podospora conica]|nr:hypothetical protein QBC39DRAFT_28426 [Schizothecium conicum]